MAKKKSTDNVTAAPFKETPQVSLDEDDFPGIKDLKIDDELTLIVKAKLMHLGRHEYEKPQKIWGRFNVESVKTDGETDPIRKGMDSVPVKNVRK